MDGPARRAVAAGFVVAAVVLGWVDPASADPPRPTNYRSRVVSISPAVPGVHVAVVGGDGFLEITVDRGHHLIVPSTNDNSPPYLRFLPDGMVQENELSVNAYLNATRGGATAVPSNALAATAATAPRWKKVASGGRWAWHDHRIHWMGHGRPPSSRDASGGKVDMGGPDGDWLVNLVVDGRPVTVRGTLVLERGVSPWPWLALSVTVGAGVTLLGRTRAATVSVGATLLAGAVALVLAVQQNAATPAGSGASQVAVALPAVGLVAVLGAATLRRPGAWVIGVLAAVATLTTWALHRLPVLWSAVLPTNMAFGLDRLGTSLALGLGVGAGISAVVSGAWPRGRSRTAEAAVPL